MGFTPTRAPHRGDQRALRVLAPWAVGLLAVVSRPGGAMADPPRASAAAADRAAAAYVTAAQPNGVAGGLAARVLAGAVARALQERGDAAEPDGALAAAAAWFAAADGRARRRGAGIAAQRAGFAGSVRTASAFAPDEPGVWQGALAAVARNLPITRYGVYLAPDGRLASVVFGDVALTLAPVPRRLRAGETVRLRGQAARRFERASLYVTGVDGRVRQQSFAGRRIEIDLPLPTPGVYRIELMGDGAGGPVVLANLPVYVGVADDADADDQDGTGDRDDAHQPPTPTPRDAQDRLLSSLNRDRLAAGLSSLRLDAELGSVALAHTQDMVTARFFGHVSPTTGRVEDRVGRAGLAVVKLGENIAQGDSAEIAYRRLMDSPSHRANLLEPTFTHVGIGAVIRPDGRPILLATMVFARRPPPPAAPVTSAMVRDFVASLRHRRGAPPLTVDPLLQRAAEAGLEAFRGTSAPAARERGLDATQATLANESRRLHLRRPTVCAELVEILELDELEHDPLLTGTDARNVGLAAASRKKGEREAIFVLAVVEGPACR